MPLLGAEDVAEVEAGVALDLAEQPWRQLVGW